MATLKTRPKRDKGKRLTSGKLTVGRARYRRLTAEEIEAAVREAHRFVMDAPAELAKLKSSAESEDADIAFSSLDRGPQWAYKAYKKALDVAIAAAEKLEAAIQADLETAKRMKRDGIDSTAAAKKSTASRFSGGKKQRLKLK